MKLGWMMGMLFDLLIMNEFVTRESEMGPLLEALGQAVPLQGAAF